VIRAFVALALPDDVRAQLSTVVESLQGLGDVRWVPEEQMHLTLTFLGDVDDQQARSMSTTVTHERWPALSLQLAGLGQFPPRGAPRVLWAGVAGDVAELGRISARLQDAGEAAGVPRERRPFHAHVTLGRCRSPRGSARLQAALRQQSEKVRSGTWSPVAVALYRSDLSAEGSVYRELARGRLG
jgi:2'-5' RNA ligase